MRGWMITLVLCVSILLSGCKTIGRWMSPIQPDELPVVSQKLLAEKDAQIQKLRTTKPTPLWPIYLVSTIALVGGAAIGYFLGKILGGVLLATGGAAAIGWMQFLERYPRAFWIPFGLGVAFAAYMAWDWYRGVRAQKVNAAVIPAIEAMGEGTQSAALKARIEANAGDALALVKAEVTAVKTEMGL